MKAISHSSPVLNRRTALQSFAAIGAVALATGAMAAEQPGTYVGLTALIAAYEQKQQHHVDMLDLEELLVDRGGLQADDMDELWDAISAAIDHVDNALVDVLAYAPANTTEAFAKARWVMAYGVGINGEWRDLEVRALVASTTGGWMET